MIDQIFREMAELGVEVPDINFFLQVAGDHLEEAREYKKNGRIREMGWQIKCLTDALLIVTALLKKEEPTMPEEEAEAMLRRGEEIKNEAMELAGVVFPKK